jgi:FkbM family methyltransferase
MAGYKDTVNNVLKDVSRITLQRKFHLAQDTYTRWLLLPNRLTRKMDHEDFLDDIYRVVLGMREGTFVDVGVNKGQTLFKILTLDRQRPYIGFEPQCMAAASVEGFLVDNNITHCRVIPIALSDRTGCVEIHLRQEGLYSMASPMASIVDGFRPTDFYKSARLVFMARGDEVIESLSLESLAFINIDVEGAELDVVRGLTMTIDKYRPFVMLEIAGELKSVPIDKQTYRFRETRIFALEKEIRSHGYSLFHILGRQAIVKVKDIHPEELNRLNLANFIAVPVESEREFCQRLDTKRQLSVE